MSDKQEYELYRVCPSEHSFGYAGEPGTCLWCGRKLRLHRESDSVRVPDSELKYGEKLKYRRIYTGNARLGDYGDGHFCGLRCGYMFGRQLADLGQRLTTGEKK